MNIWNVKNLESPPINSCKATTREIDVKCLSTFLKDGIQFFESQQHLCTEAALLSRLIYRMKMKFRSSKDFKAVEKLNRALRSYLEMQISKVLTTFLHSMPQKYKVNETYLPTKNMMDFVLVRLQGLGKILWRILETCKISSNLAQQRLRLGHFWKIAIIIYAITARIFVITKTMIKYTCDLYSNLVPFSSKLNNLGKQWLPDGYVLPKYLNEWLNMDWLDLERDVIEIPDDRPVMSYFNLIDDSDDDIEFCDEYVIVNAESAAWEETKQFDDIVELCENTAGISSGDEVENSNILNGFDDNVDIGEIINLSDHETAVTFIRKRRNDTNLERGTAKRFKNGLDKNNQHVNSDHDVITINDSIVNVDDSNIESCVIIDDTIISQRPQVTKKFQKKKQNIATFTNQRSIFNNNFNNVKIKGQRKSGNNALLVNAQQKPKQKNLKNRSEIFLQSRRNKRKQNITKRKSGLNTTLKCSKGARNVTTVNAQTGNSKRKANRRKKKNVVK